MPPGGPSGGQECRNDLLLLLEHINRQLLIELGRPVPKPSHLPDMRAGHCHATHNRLLFVSSEDEPPG